MTKEKAPVVVVVDDDPAARTSLRLLLKSLGLAAVTYESAAAFLAAFDPEQPGCLLLDIRMPIMSGLELQQQLHERGNVAPVIFLTGHGDITMAVEAMRQGAFDFLQKPFRDQELLDRVQKALARDRAHREEQRGDESIRQRLESLTPRENEVLELVTGGAPNKVIAHKLGISQRTVEIHRAHVMEKMGAESLADLIHMTRPLGTVPRKTEQSGQRNL